MHIMYVCVKCIWLGILKVPYTTICAHNIIHQVTISLAAKMNACR